MLRQLALAAFSFAIVVVVTFPYWIAVERLEEDRTRARTEALEPPVSAALRASMQCPVPETGSDEVPSR